MFHYGCRLALFDCYYFTLGRLAMYCDQCVCLSVCLLSDCLFVYLKNVQISSNFLYMLPVIAVRYGMISLL